MDQLTAYLLDAFGLGRDAGPARLTPVARGAEGRVSLLEVGDRRYAVKQPFAVNAGFTDLATAEAVARRKAAHLEAFARAGIAVPEALPDRAGRFLAAVPEELGGGLVRLTTWVDGAAPRSDFVPGLHAEQLGTLVGRLHAAAPDSDDPIGPWYRTVPPAQTWADLVSRGHGQPWLAELEPRLGEIEVLGAVVRDAPEPVPPFVVGHRDLHPDNVLLADDDRLVPVDWEDIGPVLPDRELAKVLAQWHVDGDEVDASAVRRTVQAYRAAGGTGAVRGPESFTMLLSGELNFLAEQVGKTLDPALDDDHRAHASAEVHECLLWLPTARVLGRVLELASDR
ncbi:Ser/Thr protein kinase RdoA involved in Cpx stress response, MazF antagonist [Pedococcus dokdonensis]|uniref:Ser/Thr protein kinase RdoA involved in Cpx stress response, MazF antagonist n=2 Tax=Pedococcus dokdonensis TaxID=443156 RepID=A0A1H0LUA2_9MICO|nr:Ser/Thr protein kinase RdoA involved in Cpx stress response, MazF antagonist [Pedococcus dokdonensis]